MMKKRNLWLVILAVAGIVAIGAKAQNIWQGTGTADWHSSTANWSLGHFPAADEEVVIDKAGATVVLSTSVPATGWFDSLTVNNTATLVFTNWNTALSATDITVKKDAVVTCAGPFTNAPAMSNRVWLICANLTVDAKGTIHADGRGYAGGLDAPGFGPGGGPYAYSAGGYGGRGGNSERLLGGSEYGSPEVPLEPGSGGSGLGGATRRGGAGGGAIRIEASGHVRVNGRITANGTVGTARSGCGSGGAIFITCRTFDGANGVVQVQGGDDIQPANLRPSAGGGRIAIDFNREAQSVLSVPNVFFSANRGPTQNKTTWPVALAGDSWPLADIGTVWLTGPELLNTDGLSLMGKVCFKDSVSWEPDHLTVTNGWVRFFPDGFDFSVTNDLLITGKATRFDVGGSDAVVTNRNIYYPCSSALQALRVGGNLVVSNSASLHVFSSVVDDPVATTNLGALVSVAGDMFIYNNSWVYPYSHPFNGGSPRFEVRNLSVPFSNSGIDASGLGYRGGVGKAKDAAGSGRGSIPGVGAYSGAGGGGYGGTGGAANETGGQPYGSLREPSDPGSGGSCEYTSAWASSSGGGLIRVYAKEHILLNGLLRANCEAGVFNFAGAGSGGGVYLACQTLSGTSGRVSANGGSSPFTTSLDLDGGGGGGGRIAVNYDTSLQSSIPDIIFSAAPGDGRMGIGEPGTLWFSDNSFLTETVIHSGQWLVDGFTAWSPMNLTVSNAWLKFPQAGFLLDVAEKLTVTGGNEALYGLEMTNGVFQCGGDLQMENAYLNFGVFRCGGDLRAENAYLTLYSVTEPVNDVHIAGSVSLTNGASLQACGGVVDAEAGEPGMTVTIGGTFLIGTNCWVYPTSHLTNGGSPKFMAPSLILAGTNCGFDATGRGYQGGSPKSDNAMGPGWGYRASNQSGGGGYGGLGGRYTATRGITYGDSNTPVRCGSGGSTGRSNGGYSGNGGGLIWLDIKGKAVLNGGQFLADGGNHIPNFSAGGSGGGIFLSCRRFIGGDAVFSANGGNGYVVAASPYQNYDNGGGGGGGRIAIWRQNGDQDADCTVAGGVGGTNPDGTLSYTGTDGTVVWGWLPSPGTVILVR